MIISEEDSKKIKIIAQNNFHQALSQFDSGKWNFSNGYLNLKILMNGKTDDEKEYIWVSAESLKDNLISGKVNVYPVIVKANYGDNISLNVNDICDWIIANKEGETIKGGFTDKILNRQPSKIRL